MKKKKNRRAWWEDVWGRGQSLFVFLFWSGRYLDSAFFFFFLLFRNAVSGENNILYPPWCIALSKLIKVSDPYIMFPSLCFFNTVWRADLICLQSILKDTNLKILNTAVYALSSHFSRHTFISKYNTYFSVCVMPISCSVFTELISNFVHHSLWYVKCIEELPLKCF